MTPELEKEIEKVAKKLAGFSPLQEVDDEERYYQSHKCNTYDACLKIAKSDAVKTYWQKGMYTGEEVLSLLKRVGKEVAYPETYYEPSDTVENNNKYFDSEVKDWFEQNKKK